MKSVSPRQSFTRLFRFLFLCLAISGCSPKDQSKKTFTIDAPLAPEINTNFGWLNTIKPYTLNDFRGKIVLLDFWTLGCINCQHIIPELHQLQEKYSSELVVVGVHSAKFKSEKETARIKSAISKFGIDHPVINDADFTVWKAYSVEAWPTLVLITPDGKIAFRSEGENVYDLLNPQIEKLAKEYAGQINKSDLALIPRSADTAALLKFPSKIIEGNSGQLWLSDYGNNRILQIDGTGKILTTIGKGKAGFEDGSFSNTSFNGPQGLAINNNLLYIADSKNNSIRVADLATKQVRTIAGDGKMGYYYNDKKWNEPVLPNSPWDLLIDSGYLYIANAGNHQVLRMDLKDNKVFRFAGSGYEGIKDSNFKESTFSQPSGLAKKGKFIYVADPEASAIRQVDLENKTVKTIIGKGLFQFGDQDGNASTALLQHCAGLCEWQDNLLIADTYNGKIKLYNSATKKISTLVTGLNEPNDVLVIGNDLWISDTNNHQLIKYDLVTNIRSTIHIRNQSQK